MNITKIEAVAFSRYVRISPSKVRRILDQIRSKTFSEAIILLKFMPHKACPLILKVLLSSVSNLKNQRDISDSTIFIKEARADGGPTLKRFCPHAQGRGFPIKKQTCHIIIKVSHF